MSPQVIICDELGGEDEVRAVLSAQSGGVIFIASAHADSMRSLLSRPSMKAIHDAAVFEKYVFLTRNGGVFTFSAEDG